MPRAIARSYTFENGVVSCFQLLPASVEPHNGFAIEDEAVGRVGEADLRGYLPVLAEVDHAGRAPARAAVGRRVDASVDLERPAHLRGDEARRHHGLALPVVRGGRRGRRDGGRCARGGRAAGPAVRRRRGGRRGRCRRARCVRRLRRAPAGREHDRAEHSRDHGQSAATGGVGAHGSVTFCQVAPASYVMSMRPLSKTMNPCVVVVNPKSTMAW